MKPDIDRVQVILGGVFFLGIILFEIFFLIGKLRLANSIFYVTMLLFLIGFLYTGLKRISKKSKEGVKIPWYKQPWILVSILMFVTLVMIFISNYTRNFG